MKDRFSLHIDNGQSEVREAVTILRNGGQASQSGLVGVTNYTYVDGVGSPFLPETIFNIYSTGDSNVRFSSGPSVFRRSSVELIGNGNTRASGLHITYDPELDNAYVDQTGDYYYGICVDPSGNDNTVAEFSLIRPSGTEGIEFTHISMSERGYVGVGKLRSGQTRHFDPIAPLTVVYSCDNVDNSGTIAQREQSTSPEVQDGFGQLFVKPFSVGSRTQALWFKDDGGYETNLVLAEDLDPSNSVGGLIWGDNGNTYGGWHTPNVRQVDGDKSNNTYFGWGAGHRLGSAGSVTCNTLVGYHAGSGLTPTSSRNTVVGCDSLAGFTSANNNVVIGDGNVNGGNNNIGGMDDSIIIGRSLYQGNVPSDGTLAIGLTTPLIIGQLTGSDKSVSVVDGSLSIYRSNNLEHKFTSEFDNALGRYTSVVEIIDPTVGGSSYAENDLEYRFVNDDGLALTLWSLDPRTGPMTNSPQYQVEPNRPYAQLEGDFKLRGAIRFQDNTSLSGLSYLDLAGVNGTSGIDGRAQGGQSFVVLDFSNLDLAGNVANEIRTDNTFVAVQVDGSGSKVHGTMSLQGLADYVSSGVTSIGENCNVLISNPENELNVNMAGMSRTVMIGCDVAAGASGWKEGVIIGSEAGVNATVTNPGFTIDTAPIFIGHRAGYNADNVENLTAIGTNAGKNAANAAGSLFVGSNAGLDANFDQSVGIGEHALRGQAGVTETGSGNLEIVAGIDDNDRLMHNMNGLNNRFNIMNSIAGRQDRANVAIGVPRLSPTAPLEVRRFSTVHDANGNDYVQAWYCDDVLIAYIDCAGNFVVGGEGSNAPNVEGFMDQQITGGSMASPASGLMSVYVDGSDTGDNVYVVNRDATLTGIPPSTYVMGTKFGDGYRPSWVACF